MSKSYGYGLMNSKLNTLQTLLLTPTPTPIPTLEEVTDAGATTNNTITFNSTFVPTLQSNINYGGINLIDQSVVGHYQDLSIDATMIRMNDIDNATNNKTRTTMTDTEFDVRFRPSNLLTTPEPFANMTKDIIVVNDGALNGDNKVISIEPTALNIIEYDNSIVLHQVEITPTSITADSMDLNGQFVFDVPPHCAIDPITGIDLANKGYVDSLVGQYSGGYNLYFNYSVTDPTYPTFQSLGQTVISAAQQTVVTNITSGTQEVARFITLPIGITTIPIGLWDALVYGAVSGTGGDVHYYFELYKKDALNVDTLLVTSGISPDVNASPSTNPTSYTMNATITSPITLDLTDRLFMILYVTKTGVNTINVTTYFQNDYYSFTQSTLNSGTTLLGSNNSWTGTNKFDLAVSADSIQTNAVGTTANLFTTQTTGDFNLLTSKTTGNVNILTGGSRNGTTNILTASGTSNTLNIGSGSLSTQFNGNLFSSNLDQVGTLNVGTTSATTTTLGRINNTATAINGAIINVANATGATSVVNILNGGATTGGSVNIGSVGANSTNVNIGSITSTGVVNILGGAGNSINIGTGAGARTLSIGSATNVANICGIQINTAQISNTTKITCPELASSAVGTAVSLYTANTTGTVDFLTSTSRTGFLNIQSGGSNVNTINIGNDNSNTNIRGLKVSTIDNIGIGGMSIGPTNTNAITFNNKALSGVTMAANQFVTLGTNTALPAVNQIGYIYNVALPNGAGFVDNANLTTGVAQEYGTIASLPAGVYMVSVNMNMQQVALTAITSVVITITATGNTPYIDRKAFTNGAIAVNNYSISGIVSRGAVLTAVACSMTVSFTGTAPKMSVDSFKFNIVRIA